MFLNLSTNSFMTYLPLVVRIDQYDSDGEQKGQY